MTPERPASRTLHVKGIFASNRVETMGKVADELDIPFERISGPGEKYPIGDGTQTAIIPQGMEYIIIRSGERNLSDFWRKVDAITPRATH